MEKGRFGPYELIRTIGSGAVGTVWLAEVRERPRHAPELLPGRRVAIKRLKDPPAMMPLDAQRRFQQESQYLRNLNHPNVVDLLDVDTVDVGRGLEPYIAMEYVVGKTLATVVDEGPADEALVMEIAMQVTRGLVALQRLCIIHRDIKPANLILADDGGAVKIMDLGSARSEMGRIVQTQYGMHIGTPLYFAPEQIQDDPDAVGHATDLFALGLVLYELLAGQHPYPAESYPQALHNALHAIPETLSSRGVIVSPFLEALVHALLEKDPEDRVPDAERLLEILEERERSAWWRGRPHQAAQGVPRALLPARGRGRLHGRESEAETLQEAWRGAVGGEGRTILISGPEGIGKTRLVYELAHQITREARGAAILYGAALPGGVGIAPGPLRSALRAFLGESELMEEVDRYLGGGSRLAAPFSAFLRGEEALDRSASLDADGIRATFAKVLRSIADERPVLLIVDDLHLASEEARALFAYLAHALGDMRVLMTGTAGDGLAPAWRHALHAIESATEIELEPLGVDAVRHIVEERRPRETARSVLEDLAERADGNPLYVTEYLRALDDSDEVTMRLPPPRIRDFLAARLARLSEDERELLELAAVAGYRFDPHVVADVLDRPLVPLLQDLAHLQREQGMVLSTPSDYVFESHALHEMLLTELALPLRRGTTPW